MRGCLIGGKSKKYGRMVNKHDQGRIVEALGAQALRGPQREAVRAPLPCKICKKWKGEERKEEKGKREEGRTKKEKRKRKRKKGERKLEYPS